MPSGTHSQLLEIDGESLTRRISKTADNVAKYGDSESPITLPAANAIASENFTNDADDTASATLTEGHTLVTGLADLFWAAGIRYGITVTVSENSVDITDSGAGDALPATSTACTIANQVQVNAAIDGDLAVLVGVEATKRAHIDFQDADDDSIRAIELQADEPDTWDEDEARTNPYAGDAITKAMAANGDSAAAATLKIRVLQDSTP